MDDQLEALQTIFTEFYYWVTVVMMFLIHVGFMSMRRARHAARTSSAR